MIEVGSTQSPASPSAGFSRNDFASRILFLLLIAQLCLAWTCRTNAESKDALSREAAKSCDLKVRQLEAFEVSTEKDKGLVTNFSEKEINSYLAFELSQTYHPSLRSVVVKLEELKLRAVAVVDFDRLGLNSGNYLTKLLSNLLTGVHQLTVYGELIAKEGNAHLQLEEAGFDGQSLPKILVEEIVSTVGLRQDPPFDPMKPSEMPFGIKKVELHPGYILVFQ